MPDVPKLRQMKQDISRIITYRIYYDIIVANQISESHSIENVSRIPNLLRELHSYSLFRGMHTGNRVAAIIIPNDKQRLPKLARSSICAIPYHFSPRPKTCRLIINRLRWRNPAIAFSGNTWSTLDRVNPIYPIRFV